MRIDLRIFAISAGGLWPLFRWQWIDILVSCLEHFEWRFLGSLWWTSCPLGRRTRQVLAPTPDASALVKINLISRAPETVIHHLLEDLKNVVQKMNHVLTEETTGIWVVAYH